MMVPEWAFKLPWELIREKASKHELEPELIAAVIQTESAGNSNAIRYEYRYRWTYSVNEFARILGCEPDTMEFMQKTSWGLMQVMGAVGFERGLLTEKNPEQRWPTSLLIPEFGVEYGCRHLKIHAKAKEDVASIYASYNAGSIRKTPGGFFTNQKHVDRFMSFYRELKGERTRLA